MKLTIRYYQQFGSAFAAADLFSADAWDKLRFGFSPDYSIPEDTGGWQMACERHEQASLGAAAVARIAQEFGCDTIFSTGAGRACVEYHLKKNQPHLRVICTEYSRRVVESLKKVFPQCDEISCFDLTANRWPKPTIKTMYLLYRVDTGLGDAQWRSVYANMAASNVNEVLVVATSFITIRGLASEMKCRLLSKVQGRRLTLAGYIRTKKQFTALWQPHYHVVREVPVGKLTGFLLTRTPTI